MTFRGLKMINQETKTRALVKMAFLGFGDKPKSDKPESSSGTQYMGDPGTDGLPDYMTNTVHGVNVSTKNVPAIRGVNPDQIDLAVLRDVMQSKDMATIFAGKSIRPWQPAYKVLAAVHPEFADKAFDKSSLLDSITEWNNIKNMGSMAEEMKRRKEKGELDLPGDLKRIADWTLAPGHEPQRDVLYAAVTNRIAQLAEKGTMTPWNDRRAAKIKELAEARKNLDNSVASIKSVPVKVR